MSKFDELKFMPLWLHGIAPLTITDVKSAAEALHEDSDKQLLFSQALQVVSGGWGYKSYEILRSHTSLDGEVPKMIPTFDLSGAIATAARMRPKNMRPTLMSSKEGFVKSPKHVRSILSKIAEMAESYTIEDIAEHYLVLYEVEKGNTYDATRAEDYCPISEVHWGSLKGGRPVSMANVEALPIFGILVAYHDDADGTQHTLSVTTMRDGDAVRTMLLDVSGNSRTPFLVEHQEQTK